MSEDNSEPAEKTIKNEAILKKFNELILKTKEMASVIQLGAADTRSNGDSSEDENEVVTRFETSPFYIKAGTMRDYQVRGLNWMIALYHNNVNGILADEMGLGKTLQTISLIGYLKHYRNSPSPHLVVAPKSTLANWQSEFNKWEPSLRTVCLIGGKDERRELINDVIKKKSWDVCITSYEMILRESGLFKRIHWKYVVIDEAHRIKNENSCLSRVMRMIESRHRLLLTGTPLQNNLHELWSLLNFLMPSMFNSADDFDSLFDSDQCLENVQLVERLHCVMKPFLLRRIKSEVEKGLLPKKETKVYVQLSKMQREWYTKILLKEVDMVNGAARVYRASLHNTMMQLKKVCNHPYLFDGAEPGPPFTTDTHIVCNSGKLLLIEKLLPKLMSQQSRVLLFCQMTQMMDILEDFLVWKGYKYCKLHGSTSHEDRQSAIKAFNAPKSDKFIFMLSTRAGGLGINLTTADVVILYDSDWNPQADLQAMDRAHRIGQKKQVRVFRLITENTVEERIVEKAERKLQLDRMVIQQGRMTDQTSKKLKKEEMLSIIRHGASQVFAMADSAVSDESIDVILEKGERKTAELKEQLEGMKEASLRNLTFDAHQSIYKFEGLDYRTKQRQEVFVPWMVPTRRERRLYGDDFTCLPDASTVMTSVKPFKTPKLPKQPVIHDYQFYPPSLLPLLNKEILFHKRQAGYVISAEEEPEEEKMRYEQERIDGAADFTDQDVALKKDLLQQGFADWSKRDFNNFIKATELHGKENMERVSREVEGKEPEEVVRYAEVFWQRCSELHEIDRFLSQLQRGEERIRRRLECMQALDEKMAQYGDPLTELRLQHSCKKDRGFGEEEDRYLLSLLHRLGLDKENVYGEMRSCIKNSSHMRFNFFLKSRTPAELQRRCNTLLSLVQKDISAQKEKQGKSDNPHDNKPHNNKPLREKAQENKAPGDKQEWNKVHNDNKNNDKMNSDKKAVDKGGKRQALMFLQQTVNAS